MIPIKKQINKNPRKQNSKSSKIRDLRSELRPQNQHEREIIKGIGIDKMANCIWILGAIEEGLGR